MLKISAKSTVQVYLSLFSNTFRFGFRFGYRSLQLRYLFIDGNIANTHLKNLITIIFSMYYIICMLLHVTNPLVRFNSKSDRFSAERLFYFILFYFTFTSYYTEQPATVSSTLCIISFLSKKHSYSFYSSFSWVLYCRLISFHFLQCQHRSTPRFEYIFCRLLGYHPYL